LTFVGIRRPKKLSKSTFKLLENADTESTMTTIRTSLKPQSKIADLKKLVKQKFHIPASNDVLISYSSRVISLYKDHETHTLQEFGITNNSLLTLAVCDSDKVREDDVVFAGIQREVPEEKTPSEPDYSLPAQDVNKLFGMFEDDEDDEDEDDENSVEVEQQFPVAKEETLKAPTPPAPKGFLQPFIGFDVVMQEVNYVYKMPICGHEIGKESLYHYALNTFEDDSNTTLKCPHRQGRTAVCGTEWDLAAVLEVLRHEHQKEEREHEQEQKKSTLEPDKSKSQADLMKLELLSARNVLQKGHLAVQKCFRCKTLYYKNKTESEMNLDDIKTAHDIERQFKFFCVLCKKDPNEVATVDEDEAEEETAPRPVRNVNELFADDDDSDSDDDSDDEEEEEEQEVEYDQMYDVDERIVRYDVPAGDLRDEEEEVDEDDEEQAIQNVKMLNELFDMFQEDEDDSDDEDEKEVASVVNTPMLTDHTPFCFCCGKEFKNGHVCDNSFRKDLIEVLANADPKKIGSVSDVPSIRACPTCCQLLFHIDCCKHMQCKTCKTKFCHVCLKTQDSNGKWQCGSSSTVCPAAPRQNESTLPDNIVITKQKFKLFDDV